LTDEEVATKQADAWTAGHCDMQPSWMITDYTITQFCSYPISRKSKAQDRRT